ncbi:uncharacterized protein LOC143855924 [Tasmannia lanceolata]|uniref:uncharacterized protein LOC143855924 n=1 Tax=Tasmannia lanceolata TaxID=3420 RepID=UPI004064509E
MYNNFKSEFKGKILKEKMWAAASASTSIEFQQRMAEMEKLDKDAHAYLKKINPTLWSRSAFSTQSKCSLLVNNLSETFNGFILPSRDKPILTMVETIRRLLMRRFQKQRSSMERYGGPICRKIQEKIEKVRMTACDYHVEWSSGDEYEVHRFGKKFVVNLRERSCGCRNWDLTGIPCTHAAAAIFFKHDSVEEYVHPYYRRDAFQRSYGELIHPMPSMEQWPQSDMEPVQPPPLRRPSGRPKKLRREVDEPRRLVNPFRLTRKQKSLKCSKCGLFGHNSRTCKGPIKGKGKAPVRRGRGQGSSSSSRVEVQANRGRDGGASARRGRGVGSSSFSRVEVQANRGRSGGASAGRGRGVGDTTDRVIKITINKATFIFHL